MKLDHEALARDLVRALRGRRSQTAQSRRLGVSSNTIYSWEAGRRWPTASKFFSAASVLGVDVDAWVRDFLPASPRRLDTPDGVAHFLRDLRGDTAIQVLAGRTGSSRFAVSRWLSGRAEPRFPDFLRMIEASSLRLLDFVAAWVDPDTLPSVRDEWAQLDSARDLAWSAPWTQGVLLALSLPGYRALERHDDAFLAGALAIEVAEVRRCVSALAEAGQIERRGHHWVPVALQAVDLRRAGSGDALKEHWLRTSLDRLGRGGLFSYNLFTIDGGSLEELQQMQRAYYRQVRTYVAEAPPGDRVVLLGMQLLPLSESPA